MITVPQPALALNDTRTNKTYHMKHTLSIDFGILSLSWFIEAAAFFVINAGIREIILNCNGGPGYFDVGKGKFELKDVPLFKRLGKLGIDKIWLLADEVAQTQPKGKNNRDGHAFVSAIAKAANCFVVASTGKQTSGKKNYPVGQLDSYEGLVLSYSPQGKINWHKDYKTNFAWE